jgi:hypothetical protein
MKIFSFFGRLLSRVLFNNKTVLFLLILAIGAGVTAFYLYKQNQKVLHLLNNPAQASAEEVKSLTDKIGALMELPSGEQPTVITVVEKEKLKDQPFFAKAENGDKVLVYTQAKKAILYRPSTNKIVEVGPVDISPSQTFKVAIYYSAGNAAAADSIENTLKSKVTNLEITGKTPAKGTYTKNIAIDLKGDKTNELSQLATLIDGEVGTLPSSETKPDVDFLIIVGK